MFLKAVVVVTVMLKDFFLVLLSHGMGYLTNLINIISIYLIR